MKTTKEIIGLPIVSIFDGTEIGTVKNIIINADDRSINFIVVDAGLHLLGAKVIPTDRVLGIGEYAVTVEDENVVAMISKIPAAIDLLEKNVQIKGSKVLTKKGRLAGEISEILVDEEDGCHILGMEFVPLGGDTPPVFLPDKCVITYGKHLVIVFEAFDAMLTGIGAAGERTFGAKPASEEPPVQYEMSVPAEPAAAIAVAPPEVPAASVFSDDTEEVPGALLGADVGEDPGVDSSPAACQDEDEDGASAVSELAEPVAEAELPPAPQAEPPVREEMPAHAEPVVEQAEPAPERAESAVQPIELAAQPIELAAQPIELAAQPIEPDVPDTVISFPMPTESVATDMAAETPLMPDPEPDTAVGADTDADVLELADASETVTAVGDELGQESTTLLGDTETVTETAVDVESEAGLFEERQRQYLLGRTITRNILDNGGGVIAEVGTVITPDIIARAKAEGKMVQLVMNNRA